MHKSLIRPADRRGFTLVELMVVIIIVGVLAALITAAVARVLILGPKIQTQNDINQLGISLESFKSQFGFYPPSQLILCEKLTDYQLPQIQRLAAGTPLLADSQYYLSKMFPRMGPAWSGNGVDWNGDHVASPPVLLTGDQCLVFFLGGIQQTIVNPNGTTTLTCNGFSSNPSDPSAVFQLPGMVAPPTLIGPFFEFKSERLTQLGAKLDLLNLKPNPYFSYADAYKNKLPSGAMVPYAYFSSYRRRNNYNPYSLSDCDAFKIIQGLVYPQSGMSVGLCPYASSAGQFLNPSSYQIISAGKDGVFGVGSAAGAYYWSESKGYIWQTPNQFPLRDPARIGDGLDDISNFSQGLLGSAVQ
jgi:prepilin-type N-terminal cleavage/methylation domain-containing protein